MHITRQEYNHASLPGEGPSYALWEQRLEGLLKLARANFFDAPDVPDQLVLMQEWLKQAQQAQGTEARHALEEEAPAILCSLQRRLKQQAADEARMESESPSISVIQVELKSTRLYEAAEMLSGLHEALVGLRPEPLPSEAGTPRKSS